MCDGARQHRPAGGVRADVPGCSSLPAGYWILDVERKCYSSKVSFKSSPGRLVGDRSSQCLLVLRPVDGAAKPRLRGYR